MKIYGINSFNNNNIQYNKTAVTISQNKQNRTFYNNISFTSHAIKIAWLESLPNVTKSVKTQIKEFFPDTAKVHKEIFDINKTIVNIPNLSTNSVVTKDIMPVTYPHLLIFRPNDNVFALTEVVHREDFVSDFHATIALLKRMYPKQDILFFEHGSGSLKTGCNQTPKTAGKSVTFAHGHFCVMPQEKSNIFPDLVAETKKILSNNHWTNIDDNCISTSSILDGYKIIAKKKEQTKGYSPYLAISYFDHQKKKEESLILLQDNDNAATPSQLLRLLANKFAFNDQNEVNWNYKKLLIKANNGDDYSEFNLKIKEVREQDELFEKRINEVLNENDS